jgi:DNA-binding NarL/FixJ family response regulator
MDGYLSKPVQLHDLAQAIDLVFANRRTGRSIAGPAARTPSRRHSTSTRSALGSATTSIRPRSPTSSTS